MQASSYGVIFDMDGVLIDSFEPHKRSWQVMAREYGVTMTDEQFAEVARLRQMVRDAHDGDGAAEWKAHLQPFAAESVKALTPDQAVLFITAVGRQYDPFTYPPPSNAAA